ncbi:MAG: NAD(P)/FAD-dependent oxidoreductase [Alphaproteobacteria bacterium]
MTAPTLSDDVKLTPYWWERVARPDLPRGDLPAKVDVLVIGSGYTGLNAALQTARGGRETLIVDAEDAGFGCSTRNGGQISTSIKPGRDALARRHGPALTQRLVDEGWNSLAWVEELVRTEAIDCDYRKVGRFHAAHNPAQYEALARRLADQPRERAAGSFMVPRAEQRSEIGSDAYFGGAVYAHHASVDPARLHQGLLERVMAAGVRVEPHCPATGIERQGNGFRVATARGTVAARDVVVATNGYTGKLTPWLRRRVIPIGSYVIATEALPRETIAKLIPGDRVVSDTRKVVYYYRASPDGRRIVFGGRVSHSETDPRISGPLLRDELVHIFPELRSARISHSWMGFVAYTFDELMHIGSREGLHYAMGYCGSGVGMANYLGMRLGQTVLGRPEGRTAFHEVPFQTRPFYTGNPWFLAPSVRWYRWKDSRAT